jgi:hypothetical protein
VTGDAGDVHHPGVELDEDEHVQAPEEHGVDGEKVSRQEARRLRPEEVPPGLAEPPASGREPSSGEHTADRRRREPQAETFQLTLDAQVPPAGVLARQAEDQLHEISINRRAAAMPPGIGPALRHQAPVPAQQGLGPHQEARPASAGKHTRGRGKEDPVGVGELGARNLPTEDRQFMAQHDDLEILGSRRTEPQRHQFEHAPGQDVQQRRNHVGALHEG